jgi:hypothetical protein
MNKTLNESIQEVNESFREFAKKMAEIMRKTSFLINAGFGKFNDIAIEKERKRNEIYQFEKLTGLKWDDSKGQENYSLGTDRLNATWTGLEVIENIEHDFFGISRPLTKKQKKQKQTRKNQSFYDKKHKAKFMRGK